MNRLRVLLIAEAANPEWVSVPLVGWSHAHAISQQVDAHLVTQTRNRAAIERFGWVEGREFSAIDSEAVARIAYKIANVLRGGKGKGWTTVTALGSLAYLYFEHLLWRRFRAQLRAGEYDVVHRITPLSPTAPSPLATHLRRIGVPYVVGPLNGGVPWPTAFDSARRAEKEWLSYVRGVYRLVPGYRALRRHAAAIICGSKDTYAQMPKYAADRLLYVPENAVDPARFASGPRQPRSATSGPLRVVFVGRLVPYKGVDMLVEAAAPLLASGRMVLDIIGDGPERAKLEAQVEREHLTAAVEFAAWVPHKELASRMSRADVLGFPSIREFGGGAVLEAMALGVVPVVVDYGGPAELVTEDTGVRIPLGPRAEIVKELRAALERLADDPEGVNTLAQNCIDRVNADFTWPAKARRSVEVYEWVLRRREKPDWRPAHG